MRGPTVMTRVGATRIRNPRLGAWRHARRALVVVVVVALELGDPERPLMRDDGLGTRAAQAGTRPPQPFRHATGIVALCEPFEPVRDRGEVLDRGETGFGRGGVGVVENARQPTRSSPLARSQSPDRRGGPGARIAR